MKELKFWFFSLSLFVYGETASAYCSIDTEILQTSNIYLSNRNGILDIQRSDIVDIGETIYLLCYGGIHRTGFQCRSDKTFNPSLKTVKCSRPFEASVFNIPDTSCRVPFLTYAVGFHVNGRFMEMYRNCFDPHTLALQHSIYKAYRFNNSATRPHSKWQSDDLSGQFDNVYEGKAVRACLVANLGAEEKNCKIHRGHMTPSSAFFFTEHKNATYRYLNAIPQYGQANIGNWKRIETWVNTLVQVDSKNPAKPTYDVLKVCTGALSVHKLKHTTTHEMIPIYLLGNSKIPVPKWTYKIVSHLSGHKWVMLTYNDVKLPSQQDLDQVCDWRNTVCHEGFSPKNNPNKDNKINGYTVCCEPYHFIERNLKHLTGLC